MTKPSKSPKKSPVKLPPQGDLIEAQTEQAKRLTVDPVAMATAEVVGLVRDSHIYRPAPNDTCPADVHQATWNHSEVRAPDGSSLWDEAFGAIRLSILCSVRVGSVVPLTNRNFGTETVAGIGGVRTVDNLAGGLIIGVPVAPGGEPGPVIGEDRVNLFTLTRAITLWCVTPDGEQRAVCFTPEAGPFACGIKSLPPVNGKPRSLPLWLAKVDAFASDDAVTMLARVEASMTNAAALNVMAENITPTEVLTV